MAKIPELGEVLDGIRESKGEEARARAREWAERPLPEPALRVDWDRTRRLLLMEQMQNQRQIFQSPTLTATAMGGTLTASGGVSGFQSLMNAEAWGRRRRPASEMVQVPSVLETLMPLASGILSTGGGTATNGTMFEGFGGGTSGGAGGGGSW